MSPNAPGNRRLVFRDTEWDLGTPLLHANGFPRGYRYVCTGCGELWGRVELSTRGDYQILTLPCERHGTWAITGGSFLKPLLWWGFPERPVRSLESLLILLPAEIRAHELLMRANQLLTT